MATTKSEEQDHWVKVLAPNPYVSWGNMIFNLDWFEKRPNVHPPAPMISELQWVISAKSH